VTAKGGSPQAGENEQPAAAGEQDTRRPRPMTRAAQLADVRQQSRLWQRSATPATSGRPSTSASLAPCTAFRSWRTRFGGTSSSSPSDPPRPPHSATSDPALAEAARLRVTRLCTRPLLARGDSAALTSTRTSTIGCRTAWTLPPNRKPGRSCLARRGVVRSHSHGRRQPRHRRRPHGGRGPRIGSNRPIASPRSPEQPTLLERLRRAFK